MSKIVLIGAFMLAALPLWSQSASFGTEEPMVDSNAEDRMLTPPVVTGEAYPVSLESEEHTNTLHYGVSFTSAYSDNVLGGGAGHPVSDISYSVWPTIGFDKTTARSHWELTYAPGFTFYQKTTGRNEADHSALVGFQYRLSPHVTFSARDTFQKSSSFFNQPSIGSGSVFASAAAPNDSIIAPIASRLGNFGAAAITYQYSANDMIGASATFSNLHYPDTTQVAGLWDSSAQSGSAFYTHRFTPRHYTGVEYQFQHLTSYPVGLNNVTEVNSGFLFYTFIPSKQFSLSFFGGPQYSASAQPSVPSQGLIARSSTNWGPAGGVSFDWEGRFVRGALGYSHIVNEGGGLMGAVRLDEANASVRLQVSRKLTASAGGFYANNHPLQDTPGTANGHTYSGTVALERLVGEHFNVQMGYTRLHQTYNIPLLAGAPNTNREFVSIQYSFTRPLGR
jgi:hypothetical protein